MQAKNAIHKYKNSVMLNFCAKIAMIAPPAIPAIVSADSINGNVFWLSRGVNLSPTKIGINTLNWAKNTDSAKIINAKNPVGERAYKNEAKKMHITAARIMIIIKTSRLTLMMRCSKK